jgi:hypothetical protein
MYKLAKPPLGTTEANGVFLVETNTFIPFDPANSDYQEFLRWCEVGNEPLPPDSQE